jgi:hemerythrin-like domain-containing protein
MRGNRPGVEPMKAIDVLTRDHERIQVVLALVEQGMRELAGSGYADTDAWFDLLRLCEAWVDRAHVLKEEEGLFPLLRSRGLGPEITVVAALMSQHQTGQAFLRQWRKAVERLAGGDATARQDVIVWARDYVELLREHMRIEDQYFYELADGTLTPADDEALLEKFERIDRTIGATPEQQRRWAAMVASQTVSGRPH